MTEFKKPAWGQSPILAEIEKLKAEFTLQAADNRGRIERLEAAANHALFVADKKNQELQNQVDAFRAEKELRKMKLGNKRVRFLFDGSGSMNPILPEAIESVKTFSDATSAKTQVVLWGNFDSVEVVKDLETAKKGLNSSSELLPAINFMTKALAKKEKQRFVIVSDGDVCDFTQSLEKMSTLLTASPKATIDLIIINTGIHQTQIAKFAAELNEKFAGQINVQQIEEPIQMTKALAVIAARYVAPVKAKKAPQPKAQVRY